MRYFLRDYFATNKKFGSKDRKQIRHLSYCYYRTGKLFHTFPPGNDEKIETRILIGLFFCSHEDNDVLAFIQPAWNEMVELSPEEKWAVVKREVFRVNDHGSPLAERDDFFSLIFPWKSQLSDGIHYTGFVRSLFIQPDFFARIRPGYTDQVKKKLMNRSVSFQMIREDSLSFYNAAQLNEVVELDKEVVVQDDSSQRIAGFLKPLRTGKILKVWDCCAASGGKSILARDVLGEIELTVSDIRESILINLHKRFSAAGIKDYRSRLIDLTKPLPPESVPPAGAFDLVICDVPCSGSGTWARTPEQLYFWSEIKITSYVQAQERIISHIIPHIKKEGYLLYITCSIFKEENENRVYDTIRRNDLKLLQMELITGYDRKADTMFAALLQKK